MRSALEVVTAGPTATLQDGGRVGAARWGVPRSGPVDALSHRLAVRLAGVAAGDVRHAVALEVGPRPCAVRAVDGPVPVALAGHGARLEVLATVVPAPCVVVLPPGEVAHVHARTWAYLAPAADVLVDAVLGSRSHHPRSGLGPAVHDGDVLPLGAPRAVRAGRRQEPATAAGPLEVLAAPQTHLFTPAALRALTTATFRTTAEVDRMGQRLDGPALRAVDGHDIVSDAIVPGALQVPGDGRPFVLTADHQSTGGYPKIAVLGTAALARLVRLPPGSDVRFTWGEVAGARAALQAAVAAVEACVDGPVRPSGLDLRDANLVAGVTDGTDGTEP